MTLVVKISQTYSIKFKCPDHAPVIVNNLTICVHRELLYQCNFMYLLLPLNCSNNMHLIIIYDDHDACI